jgi:hypothetical protein
VSFHAAHTSCGRDECSAFPMWTIITSDSGAKTMSTTGMWNDATANSANVAASKLADTAYCEK